MILPKPFYKHLSAALLVGLALRLFFLWRFPFASGDTPYYEELARNWLYHGVYGFISNGLLSASAERMPGYPAFLAIIYSLAGPGRTAVLVVQAFLDLATCVLVACIAARLAAGASEPIRTRITITALWLAVLCPFTANYVAVLLTEVLATFLTTIAILLFLTPSAFDLDLIRARSDLLRSVRTWFLAGLVVGLGTLVRPETPLLLVAVLLVYALRWWRPANWEKLAVAGLWVALGVLVPLAPWAARNARVLGRVQFLAPRYAETFGDVMPTGFYAWTQTWMFRSRDAYLFAWKLPADPIALSDVPAYAFDSPDERLRVASLLELYNRQRGLALQSDLAFANLARERTLRHPIRSYLWIPVERAGAMWFTPRIALLPYSGQIWPLTKAWHENPAAFDITIAFTLLNFLYAGLALFGALRWRQSPGIALIVAFIVIRTAYLTQLQTCEPRYVLVCFPALLALAAQSWRTRRSNPAHASITATPTVHLAPVLQPSVNNEAP
ncbi:MAG TPA: hypothetical protein VFI95_21935 [Terriglobales bacterium]|jgi:4-amino-4-deoxy-L-arabinose transferase-like glycosyltransferase|nr:hypothetical protein [Terriglobales bacterium]